MHSAPLKTVRNTTPALLSLSLSLMANSRSSQQPPTELSTHHSNTPTPLTDTRQQHSLSPLSLLDHTSFEEQFAVPSPKSQTLELNDFGFDGLSFSQLLEGGFEGQFEMSHQEVLASVTAKAAQAQVQMEIESGCAYPSTRLSPVTQAESTVLNLRPVTHEALSIPEDNICMPEVNQQTSTNYESGPALMTFTNDDYNWRKYGQKQVKNAKSSRNYYKCANSGCHAKKKVQRCDHSGCVIEIINNGLHNHDPPPKIRCTRSRRLVSSAGPVVGSDTVDRPVQRLDDSDQAMPRREPRTASLPAAELEAQTSSSLDGDASIKVEEEDGDDLEAKQRSEFQQHILLPPEEREHNLFDSNGIAGIEAQEEHTNEPRPKRRMKERDTAYSGPVLKTVKEPKVVVHAAGDVGISSDGYRWRKYGQKIVKGNSHPRSYYRCTSAGCPVRKHVEMASDDAAAVIVTYEGKHDHDMPVPKKRRGPPSSLLIATAAAVNNVQFKKYETLSRQKSPTQWLEDIEGDLISERAMELGGEKALESARALLSMAIEIRPC